MTQTRDEHYYAVALLHVPGIGIQMTRYLLNLTKSYSAILQASLEELTQKYQVKEKAAREIVNFDDWKSVDDEMELILKNDIRITTILDDDFPTRMLLNDFSPTVLFYKGDIDFNPSKCLSFVGTRKNSGYGKDITRRLISEIADHQPTIISGLAFGIDIVAHRAALDEGLPTIAVVAHGLHTIYPSTHRHDVYRMIHSGGGVCTHFLYRTESLPAMFADRNKVIAALSDATVVVESARSGGSMITAQMAFEYNREVLAVPGRAIDPRSAGPNYLIQRLRASMIQSGADIEYIMNWTRKKQTPKAIQKNLFIELSDEENQIINLLKSEEQHADIIADRCRFSPSKLNALLVQMELKGLIKVLPGRLYRLQH